ncbi:MAG: AMP-binding protein [bacterium]
MMRDILARQEDKCAIHGFDGNFSYKQFKEQVNRFSLLVNNNPGGKVLIFMENRPEWIFSLYATWKNKGIVVPVDFLSSPDDLTYILDDCKPETAICSSKTLDSLQKAIDASVISPVVIDLDQLTDPGSMPPPEGLSVEPADTALILYTSGTTGSPKGVMLSFQNLFTNLEAVCEKVPIITERETVLILLPLHHIFPLMGTVIGPFYSGGTVAISPSLSSDDIMETMGKYKVSLLIGVPRLFQTMYKGIKAKINASKPGKIIYGLSSLIGSRKLSKKLFGSVHKKFGGHIRWMVSGGAKLDPEVSIFFKNLGFEILEGYGMTESAPMITFSRPGRVRAGSPGEVVPGIEVRIEQDEIITRGPNVMQGYYNRPEETSDVIKDGWLYTGDLGYLDKDGYLHITGRKKEIIILSNGKNINPEEVEKKLGDYSECIKEAGVFLKDNILQAIILPDFPKLATLEIGSVEDYFRKEIIARYNEVVSPYKKILRFRISREELPKTRLGKIKRFELPLMADHLAVRKEENEPDYEEYSLIKNYIENEISQQVYPGDHLELDLALDSLGKVSLTAYIETTFGVKIDEKDIAGFSSVAKLTDYVHERKTKMEEESVNWSTILREKVHFHFPKTWFTHNLIKYVSRVVLNLFFRVKVKGIKNLPETPCIIAPNHQSFLDGFLVSTFFRRNFMKKTYFYAKEKYFKTRILKFLARRNNIILLDLNKDLKGSLQRMAEVLKKGKNIMIFPEGTRTLTGKLGEFKQTFAILAQELNVPVIPVAINGAYDIMPRGKKFPRLFRKINIHFLNPVYPDNHDYESLKTAVYHQVVTAMGE